MTRPTVISLFSGAGGLDLGFKLAGYSIAYAVDVSPWAIATHRRNFPRARAVCADLVAVGAAEIVQQIAQVIQPGERIGVIGGPPCQGFSRANTNSDPQDPRNQLPLLYLDIVAELQSRFVVDFVLFENVLGIRDAKHRVAFAGILERLRGLGFAERVDEYSALDFGVPQKRNRVVITGFRNLAGRAAFDPRKKKRVESRLTVRSAISGFPEPRYYERDLDKSSIDFHPNHWTMNPRSPKFSAKELSPTSARSFKRLAWDDPSPTVAYGHREIHIHPLGHRRLSIREAMTLQGFPTSFVLEGPLSSQVDQVSNAVPPPLAKALAHAATKAVEISYQ